MSRRNAASLRAYAATFESRGRVIACRACARAVAWRGHGVAHREGWTGELGRKGALVWTCDECSGGQKDEVRS